MVDQEVPKNLQKRVVNYLNYLWERNKSIDIKEQLADAPYCMRAELYLCVTSRMLSSVSLCVERERGREMGRKQGRVRGREGDRERIECFCLFVAFIAM